MMIGTMRGGVKLPGEWPCICCHHYYEYDGHYYYYRHVDVDVDIDFY